jgi:hypothetical protein
MDRSDYYKKRYEIIKNTPDKWLKLKTYMKEAGKRAYEKRKTDSEWVNKMKDYHKDRY